MKKISVSKIIVLAVFTAIFALTAFACTEKEPEEPTVKSITVVSAPEEAYIKGDTNIILSDVILEVVYTDKNKKTVSLDDSMISGVDRLKFQQAGRHTVTVSYDGGTGFYTFEVVDVAAEGKFVASFYSRGGSDVKSIAGTTITAFSMPEREGYVFDGWYPDVVFDDNGAVLNWGERVSEPYTLTANTSFYAKWIDKRVCTVKFYDYDGSVIYEEEIHYGEKIDVDSFVYPDDRVTPGKTFLGWNVTNGNANAVTVDLIVKANFSVEKCIVKVVYANTNGETIEVERTFDYGTEFTVGEGTTYVKPEKEGYTSRFVYYVNHAEDNENEEDGRLFSEMPDDNTVTLTEPYTTIKPEFTVLTYKIVIFNGKTNQTKTNLKNGTPELERTYENAAASRDFIVEWNTGFDFSEHTQEPDVSSPALLYDENGVVGYSGQWCYVVTDSDGNELWYNGSGLVWDRDEQIFVSPSGRATGESDSLWTLRDADGNYIALIKNGKLTEIKSDVTVKALYTKKTFDVKLVRQENGAQKALVTFKVKYLSDINIYDAICYPHSPEIDGTQNVIFPAADVTGYFISDAAFRAKALEPEYNPYREGTDIEKLFLKENTDLSVKKQSEEGGYYVTNEVSAYNMEEDWVVEWYTAATFNSAAIDFRSGETVEIGEARTFYCKDTDKRKYEVLFFYEYDFAADNYVRAGVSPKIGQEYYTEEESVNPPITNETVTCEINGVTVPYVFTGWYDVPFGLYLKTGYRGKELTDFNSRKSSVYYYAHYECNKTVTVKMFDRTQSTAYIGMADLNADGFSFESCLVADNTIIYTLPIGEIFDLSMVYKGKSEGTQTNISGQTYYDNAMKNAFFKTYYKNGTLDGTLKTYIESRFGNKDALEKIKKVIDAFIADYKNAISTVYGHDYSAYTTGDGGEYEYYLTLFDNAGSYGITDFPSEFAALSARGTKITDVLTGAGYSDTLMGKLGNIDEFIEYYADLLRSLYGDGYREKHTGFNGINYFNTSDFASYGNGISTYAKLLTVNRIIAEYIEFMDEYSAYSLKEVSPKYETSPRDLNNAYGFNGTTEIKYSFSGWYENATYTDVYGSEFEPLTFTLENDVTLYAKWTDVTRGTEGLVYEEVERDDGHGNKSYAYVLVDFVNREQYNEASKGYTGANKEFYYVTTNDTGAVPETILTDNLEIQIPAEISKYLDKTAEATALKGTWSTAYKDFYVYGDGTYVQASATFDDGAKYYKREEYPVIGIKAGAFDGYAQYINAITIPLNLYFLEEGAFRYCVVTTFARTPEKSGETKLDYVVIDNDRAIYQKDECPYAAITGRGSGYVFKAAASNTVVGYTADYSEGTEYTLLAGTERIGAYAFANATYLTALKGTESVVGIGKQAFRNAAELVTFGAVDGKITLNKKIAYVGEEAFAQCTKISAVEVESGSVLAFIGKNAFYRTNWYDAKKGIKVIRFTDDDGRETGIILGFYSGSLGSDYDKDKAYDADGNESATGEYFGIKADGATLLMTSGGSVAYVIIDFEVKFICDGAFDGLNAQKYTFNKGVKEIGDRAFAGHAALEEIVFKEAFGTEGTNLGDEVFYGRGTAITVRFGSEAVKNTVTSGLNWNAYSEILLLII